MSRRGWTWKSSRQRRGRHSKRNKARSVSSGPCFVVESGEKAELGVKIQHRVVGVKIDAVTAVLPVRKKFLQEHTGEAALPVRRSGHHGADLDIAPFFSAEGDIDEIGRDIRHQRAVNGCCIGEIAVCPISGLIPLFEVQAEHSSGQLKEISAQGGGLPDPLFNCNTHLCPPR